MQNSWGWRGCITTNVALSGIFFLYIWICREGVSTAHSGALWRPDTPGCSTASKQPMKQITKRSRVFLCRPGTRNPDTNQYICVDIIDMDDVIRISTYITIKSTQPYLRILKDTWTARVVRFGCVRISYPPLLVLVSYCYDNCVPDYCFCCIIINNKWKCTCDIHMPMKNSYINKK